MKETWTTAEIESRREEIKRLHARLSAQQSALEDVRGYINMQINKIDTEKGQLFDESDKLLWMLPH